MKVVTFALLVAAAMPLASYADSSQPNSAPGLEGRPVTTQGEGTTGINEQAYPGKSAPNLLAGRGATDAGKTGTAGTTGAADSSIPGATNPNEPIGTRR